MYIHIYIIYVYIIFSKIISERNGKEYRKREGRKARQGRAEGEVMILSRTTENASRVTAVEARSI
jgi:hypothetical protein